MKYVWFIFGFIMIMLSYCFCALPLQYAVLAESILMGAMIIAENRGKTK